MHVLKFSWCLLNQPHFNLSTTSFKHKKSFGHTYTLKVAQLMHQCFLVSPIVWDKWVLDKTNLCEMGSCYFLKESPEHFQLALILNYYHSIIL